MMKNVDHIGIAVTNMDESVAYYTEVLGLKLLKIEEVPSQRVKVAFIDAGNVKIELLEPTSEESTIHGFIQKKGQGIHHVAFGVTSIEERMVELRDKGVRLLSDGPLPGAGGAQVAFVHPKDSFGVLYELCDKSGKGEQVS
jgi:methylmalonyl-CoA/ethylmalonyl-CoA epimerase